MSVKLASSNLLIRQTLYSSVEPCSMRLESQGHSVGESYVVDEDVPIAKALLDEAESKDVRLVLPADSLEADDFSKRKYKQYRSI